jgi:hypothetical protein
MDDPRQDPRFAVALLKVAVQLRKPEPRGLDAILASVLSSLGFDPEAFSRFVRVNRPLLEFTAQGLNLSSRRRP